MARAFLVAGTHSGCGKTSVSLGLMAALARRGVVVQPFKAGPDFIDPSHHQALTRRQGENLDGWMCGHDTVRSIFRRAMRGAEVGVVEGAMGLHDGFTGDDARGSAAELARLLDIPVLLVVDAKGMARSAAALVKGYVEFDPELRVAGVVFNRVGSANHENLLAQAMAPSPVPMLGSLPRREDIAAPSRHLGLVMGEELDWDTRRELLADWVEAGLDLDRLLDALPAPGPEPQPRALPADTPATRPRRIGLARDEAFCFYYAENIRLLEASGFEVVIFSPLADERLPSDLDGLYLGGGYPELHGARLAANQTMRADVAAFAGSGRPVYAECGGFMYLMHELVDAQGHSHAMAGVFDLACRMQRGLAALGYRQVCTLAHTPLGPKGTTLRGHEFHYSRVEGEDPEARDVYQVSDRRGPNPKARGLVKDGTLGSYIHLHFASDPAAVRSFFAEANS